MSASPPQPVSLMRHYSRYLSANVLGLLAGFISYPIMARLISKYDFGIIGYFETISLVWVAVFKLGVQQAIIRFYPAFSRPEDQAPHGTLATFYASLFWAPMAFTTGVFALILGGIALWHQWWPIEHIWVLVITLIISQATVIISVIENIMRARELSRLASIVSIIQRYARLALLITFIAFISRTALGVMQARMIGTLLGLGWFMWWLLRHCPTQPAAYDGKVMREGLHFGLPMVVSELSFIALAFADRIMIKHLTGGFEQLGVYNFGYGLAMYVGLFMRTTLNMAFEPVASRLYEHEGAAAVQDLKHKIVRLLLYAAISISVGLVCVGRDFFVIIASEKNLASTPVFIWVGITYLIQPVFYIASYGLILEKRTKTNSAIVMAAVALNIALNFALIPRLGIMGAVYASLASYLFLGTVQMAMCPAGLRTMPGLGEMARPLACGALMLAAAQGGGLWGLEGNFIRLAVMAVIFVATFIVPALVIDAPLRRFVIDKLNLQRFMR